MIIKHMETMKFGMNVNRLNELFGLINEWNSVNTNFSTYMNNIDMRILPMYRLSDDDGERVTSITDFVTVVFEVKESFGGSGASWDEKVERFEAFGNYLNERMGFTT